MEHPGNAGVTPKSSQDFCSLLVTCLTHPNTFFLKTSLTSTKCFNLTMNLFTLKIKIFNLFFPEEEVVTLSKMICSSGPLFPRLSRVSEIHFLDCYPPRHITLTEGTEKARFSS